MEKIIAIEQMTAITAYSMSLAADVFLNRDKSARIGGILKNYSTPALRVVFENGFI